VNELYSRPEIYESLFDDFDEDVKYIAGIIAGEPARPPGLVLELACGGGRVIGALARRLPPGWAFAGADLSPAMLDRARARWGEGGGGRGKGWIDWFQADILETGVLPEFHARCGVVLLVANSLGHFTEGDQRKKLYANVQRWLAPTGIGICAVLTAGSFADSESGLVEVGSARDADGTGFEVYESSHRDGDAQIIKWSFLSDDGDRDFENTFRLARFEQGQLETELLDAGFSVLREPDGSGGNDGNFWDICVYRHRRNG
jgi:SAM-dependent methyltransferase